MRLFYMIQQSNKETRRENATAATRAGFDAGMSAAKNICSAADERQASAYMSAGASIAGGALQVGGGVAGGALGIKSAREGRMATDAQTRWKTAGGDKTSAEYTTARAEFAVHSERSATLGSRSQAFITSAPGSAQAVSGAGQMAAADKEHEASDIDAQKMKWEAVRAAFRRGRARRHEGQGRHHARPARQAQCHPAVEDRDQQPHRAQHLSAPAIITDETAIMQTTSVANSNPAAVPAWTDGSAAEATGAGRTGPVPSGAEEMSGEDLVRLIAKELKEGAGGDGVFNANGAPALGFVKSFSMNDMVDLLRVMQSKNQEVQSQTAKEGIQNDLTKRSRTAPRRTRRSKSGSRSARKPSIRARSARSSAGSARSSPSWPRRCSWSWPPADRGPGSPMIALATLALIGSSMALADQISRECGGPEISLTNMVTTMVAKTLEACGVDAETAERIGKIAAGAVAIMFPVVLVVDPSMLGAMALGIAELAGADANQAALAAMIVTIATALTVGIVSGVLTGGASTAGTAAKIATTIIGASSAIIQGSMGIAKGANDLKVADLQHDAEYARAEQQKLQAICLELQNRLEQGMEELKKIMEAMDEAVQLVSQMLKDGADSMVQVAANISKRQPI